MMLTWRLSLIGQALTAEHASNQQAQLLSATIHIHANRPEQTVRNSKAAVGTLTLAKDCYSQIALGYKVPHQYRRECGNDARGNLQLQQIQLELAIARERFALH